MKLGGWANRRRVPPSPADVLHGEHGAMAPLRSLTNPRRLVQPEHAVDGPQFGRLDQLGMRHGNREQRALELLLPEGKEIFQRWKFRKQIVILPDIGL